MLIMNNAVINYFVKVRSTMETIVALVLILLTGIIVILSMTFAVIKKRNSKNSEHKSSIISQKDANDIIDLLEALDDLNN